MNFGVIGAGQMGGGIAQVAAQSGFTVVVHDQQQAFLDRGRAVIEKSLGKLHEKGKLSDMPETVLGRITFTTDLADFAACDLVVEAIVENEGVKAELFRRLGGVVKPEGVLASNTSSIPITALATASGRPAQFIGMHFMNPVPVMKLVEVIRGIATDEPTFQAVQALAHRLGKTTAVAEDFPAFIVNRILIPMINEAVYTLHEGVGSIQSIDSAMKLGANHPMGPLELADFIGLDTCLAIMHVLYDGLADSKYRPCPLLVKYVEAGWVGRKAGRGFYDYSKPVPVPTR